MTALTEIASQDLNGVKIGTEVVNVGDSVAENTVPWIKAMVIGIEALPGGAATELTVVWLEDARHGNLVSRKGRTRKYVVNSHGVSNVRKVR
jgi:hypothetical protein